MAKQGILIALCTLLITLLAVQYFSADRKKFALQREEDKAAFVEQLDRVQKQIEGTKNQGDTSEKDARQAWFDDQFKNFDKNFETGKGE